MPATYVITRGQIHRRYRDYARRILDTLDADGTGQPQAISPPDRCRKCGEVIKPGEQVTTAPRNHCTSIWHASCREHGY